MNNIYNEIEAYKDGILAMLNITKDENQVYLTIEKLQEIITVISQWNEHENIGAIVLHSTCEGIFSEGANPEYLDHPHLYGNYRKLFAQLCKLLEESDKLIIALVNGRVYGSGFELILSCDLRFATANASFRFYNHVRMKTAVASTHRLAAIMGQSRTLQLLIEDAVIQGKEAYHIGLVTKLIDEDKLWSELFYFGDKLASISIETIVLIKKLTTLDGFFDKKNTTILEQLFHK